MRALVTGVTREGIGGAICRRVAADALARGERACLTITATGTRPGLAELVDELAATGTSMHVVHGDLADPGEPAQLVQESVQTFGGLDALVVNHATNVSVPLAELELDDWDRVFAVNVRAAWLLARAAHPALAASRGAIVTIASLAGTYAGAGHGAYAPSKAALIMLAQTLAVEWGSDGIRTNVVSPGPIRTPMSEWLYADPGEEARRSRAIPVGRLGRPDDIAAMVSFLVGPDASFVNGENVVVDGGLGRAGLRRGLGHAPAPGS